MIINPPNDYEPIDPYKPSHEQTRRVELYLGVKPWKCECGTMVFGRCLECPYCKHRLGKVTLRPSHYTKERGA